jgi:transposase InsO family protein
MVTPNHVWSYDFVQDRTHDGRIFRALNIIDEFTKEALVIRVKRKLNSTDVVDALTDLFILRGPAQIHKVRQQRRIYRREGANLDRRRRGKDRFHRTRFTLGERILRELQRPVSG